MDDSKPNASLENPPSFTNNSPKCENETLQSGGVSQSSPDKKKSSSTTDSESVHSLAATSASFISAQEEQEDAIALSQISTEENFSLRIESNDESENFEDAVSGETIRKEKKSEKLFSDIESSDDSIAYESDVNNKSKNVKSVGKTIVEAAIAEEESPHEEEQNEKSKVVEPEFEPVESDEEFFEEPLLLEELEELSEESIPDKKLDETERKSQSQSPLLNKGEGSQCEATESDAKSLNGAQNVSESSNVLSKEGSKEDETSIALASEADSVSTELSIPVDEVSKNMEIEGSYTSSEKSSADEIKKLPDEPETTSKSSTNLEHKTASPRVSSETIETNIEIADNLNRTDVANEKIQEAESKQLDDFLENKTLSGDNTGKEITELSKESENNKDVGKENEDISNSIENIPKTDESKEEALVKSEPVSSHEMDIQEGSEKVVHSNEADNENDSPMQVDELKTNDSPAIAEKSPAEDTFVELNISEAMEADETSEKNNENELADSNKTPSIILEDDAETESLNTTEKLDKIVDETKETQECCKKLGKLSESNEELNKEIQASLNPKERPSEVLDSIEETTKKYESDKKEESEKQKKVDDDKELETVIDVSEEEDEGQEKTSKPSESKDFPQEVVQESEKSEKGNETESQELQNDTSSLSKAYDSNTEIESTSDALKIPSDTTEELLKRIKEVAAEIEETISKADSIPEVIEIDDDDDFEDGDQKEPKKQEEKLPTDEPVVEKEKADQNESLKTLEKDITPMEIDENLSTLNEEKEKPTQDTEVATPTADDDDEPLLMIDTSHKDENDLDSNNDNETPTSAPTTTDSSSDGSLEVFYDKECINYECKKTTKNYYRATGFSLSYFKVTKKRSKTQFVCEDCYDQALESYENLCKTLKLKQPLIYGTTLQSQEFVEIIDSSDEEEVDTAADKTKDENTLPKETIEMLQAELEGTIRKVMQNVDIQNQLSWTKQVLQQRLTNLQEDSDFVTEQLRSLQKQADQMHNSLYQCPKIKLRQLTPLDLNSGRMYNPDGDSSSSKFSSSQIPPSGEVFRPTICVNEHYYAVKTKAIASWVPCKVIEEAESYPVGIKAYKIKFTKFTKYPMFRTVIGKHMAYYDPPSVRLPIGSRVIAYFDATSLSRGKEKMLIPSAFYPGIIAEPLKQSNKFRYLIFYDDGYFQYVSHKDVRLVCQASENVWEDVHHQSREFIHNYLTQYAVNRPMVQTQKGQSMLVDYNGKWIYARVIDVDCSLVQMLFEGQSRSEWIYRGSTRLGPVYKESNNLAQKNTLNATRRRTEPFIRYINGDDSSTSQQAAQEQSQQPQQKTPKTGETRSVAKKSVSRVDTSNNNNNNISNSASAQQPVPTVRHLNNSTIFVDDDNKPKGKVVYYTARKNLPPRNYVPHLCNPACPFNITHNLTFYSPLAKPLLSGWERQVFRQKSKKFIVYRGPCGKRMRNIEELHRYLRVTDNDLNVDNFDFSPETNCLAEYVLEKCLVNKKDISCGKEKMPIPCVNYYDESMPPACEYSAVRIPTEGVPLNLDEEFLCGCDCEDDCSDKTRCACWKLTYAGAKYGMPSVPTEMVGYQYKRLYEHVPTGIYECNSRCKCKSNCLNRVVQQPLQSKLQVFKTSNRGWGLRCINDVPRGSFICVYAGQMLTEQKANEGGLDAGDEYFAELDYIEVAEQIKEGYESDVQEPEEEEDLYNPELDDDDTDFRASLSVKDVEFNTQLRARRGNKNSTDGEFDSQERQVISFEPNKNMDASNEANEKPTIRKLFGKDESCYVMDAKVRGNLGRYFNHSCSPNLFVQNVFVDTHDLRFPWVAFFASTQIKLLAC